MLQNFPHKRALLNAFAEILPRGSVLLCFTRLTHTAINFPQRQIFGVLTSIYWTLTEVAWDGAIYWRSYLPQCSTCQDQVEGIDERMMSDRAEEENVFLCLRLFHLVLDRRHQLRIKIPQQGQVDLQISLLGKRLRHLVTSILFYFGGMPCSAVDPQRLQHFQSCTNVNIQMLESPRFPNLDYVLKINPQNSSS